METLDIAVRSQYTFTTDNRAIACLLTRNVKLVDNPHVVNIVSILSVKINETNNLVKIVVGTDDPNNPARGGGGDSVNPDPLRTNELQNKQFRANMRYLGIEFTEEPIIQIFNVEDITGTPGIYRVYYSSLVCAEVNIIAFYGGEAALSDPLVTCGCDDNTTQYKCEVISCFIEVDNIDKALEVLRALNLSIPFDETQVCINAVNVDCKCTRCRATRCKVMESKIRKRNIKQYRDVQVSCKKLY